MCCILGIASLLQLLSMVFKASARGSACPLPGPGKMFYRFCRKATFAAGAEAQSPLHPKWKFQGRNYFMLSTLQELFHDHECKTHVTVSTDGSRIAWSKMANPKWVRQFSGVPNSINCPRNLKPSHWEKKVCDTLKNSPADSLDSSLNELCARYSHQFSAEFIEHILHIPEISKSPAIALGFFNWAARLQGYQHTMFAYAYVVDSLGSIKDIANVKAVADALKGNLNFLHWTTNACNILMKNFGILGLADEALYIWNSMIKHGIDAGIFTYNCLINSLLNAERLDEAENVLETMKSQGRVAPNVVTYNMIIKGVCKAGRTESAMEYFREMEKTCYPDQITYVTLMQRFHAEGRYDKTISLFLEMRDKKLRIIPHAYSLVICGLTNEGKVMEAYKLFQDMMKTDCKPNLPIYTALIDGFFKAGIKEKALDILKDMEKNGFKPDKVTCAAVISGLCKVGEVEMAHEYLNRYREMGLDVNAFSYCSIIDGLGQRGKIKEAEDIFEEMADWGCDRDTHCYNSILDGLCKAKKFEKSRAILHHMEREGCQPTVYTYSIFIDGLLKARKTEEALKLWNEMIDRGIAPTAASFRILSNGLCLSGKVTRACRILDELATMGVVPDTAHQDMINVLVKAGRVEQACKLADGIIDRGREIPGRVRSIFLNALRKAGNAELALKLVHSKIGIGFTRYKKVKKRVKFRTLVDPST